MLMTGWGAMSRRTNRIQPRKGTSCAGKCPLLLAPVSSSTDPHGRGIHAKFRQDPKISCVFRPGPSPFHFRSNMAVVFVALNPSIVQSCHTTFRGLPPSDEAQILFAGYLPCGERGTQAMNYLSLWNAARCLTISGGALLVFLFAPAYAQRWMTLGQVGDSEEFIDANSIRSEGVFVRYWTKSVYAAPKRYPASGEVFQVVVSSFAVNCTARTFAITSSTSYTAQGDLVKTFDYNPPNFRDAPPGTVVAQLIQSVCRVVSERDAEAAKPPGKQKPQIMAKAPDKQKSSTGSKETELSSTGTGFFVSPTGQIVTNAHVVNGCKEVRYQQENLTVSAVDAASDLALLSSNRKSQTFGKIRSGRGPRPGEEVVTVGFPLAGLLSSDPIVTTGIISALAGIRNDRRFVQTTAPVQPGNSGGPLLGENGAVVGVVVGKLNALAVAEATGDLPQNVNFAVSLGTLQSFLDGNSVPYEFDDRALKESTANIAARASVYTVLLQCWK
jgi:S1-C subfamily serine protease